jgi:metallophosphoesterase (TIGR00282 family)
MKLLFVGDVIGGPGRRALTALLPSLRTELSVDIVIANAENLAGGAGVTAETVADAFAAGVDFLTGGNHIFDKREGHAVVRDHDRIVRPANYPPGVPGRVLGFLPAPGGLLAVGGVLGRVFMRPLDDPFRAADALVERAEEGGARYIVIDVHAEASAEKIALGWYLDGRVSLVAGTHTHVPTADARILPEGTAYITDVGMTGPYHSVIGMEKEPVLAHFLTGLHHRFKPAGGDVRLSAVLVELDESTGRASSIRRIERPLEDTRDGG